MSLLSEIRSSLENSSKLAVVGIDTHHAVGSFNTYVFRVAPKWRLTRLNKAQFQTTFYAMQSLIPHPCHRVVDHSGMFNAYGVLIYKETIGKERVMRTFSVDDATDPTGEEFALGPHPLVEQELVRTIKVTLYPIEEEARKRISGRTIYEAPEGVAG